MYNSLCYECSTGRLFIMQRGLVRVITGYPSGDSRGRGGSGLVGLNEKKKVKEVNEGEQGQQEEGDEDLLYGYYVSILYFYLFVRI